MRQKEAGKKRHKKRQEAKIKGSKRSQNLRPRKKMLHVLHMCTYGKTIATEPADATRNFIYWLD